MKPLAAMAEDPAGVLTGAAVPAYMAGWLLDTESKLEAAVNEAVEATVLALDTETFGFNAYALNGKAIFGASFAWRTKTGDVAARYIPLRHSGPGAVNLKVTPRVRKALRRLLTIEGPLRVGHNFRFDAGFFSQDDNFGCLPVGPVEDTQWLAWLENEERGFGQYKLKVLGQIFVEKSAKSMADDLADLRKVTPGAEDNWSLLPVDEVGPYAAQDARLTLLLWEALDASIKAQDERAEKEGWKHAPLSRVRELEREATLIYWGMEWRGLAIDYDYAVECLKRVREGRDAAAKQMSAIVATYTGVTPETCEPSRYEWVAQQLVKLGYDPDPADIDKRGIPKTNSLALARNGMHNHPFVKALYRWRAYNGADKKYFAPLVAKATPDPLGTGAMVVHSEFYQTRARSGRVQAANPNFMNIPLYKVGMSRMLIANNLRAGEAKMAAHGVQSEEDDEALLIADEANVRRAMRARPGYTLVFADFSQQELRAFVEISKEPTLLRLLQSGADLHYETASAVVNMPTKEEVPDADQYKMIVSQGRSVGKLLNFGMIFGMGAARYYETAAYDRVVETEVEAFEARLEREAAAAPPEQVLAAVEQFRMARRRHYWERAEREGAGYHKKYPYVRRFHKLIVLMARKRGYITNKYGRRRRVPWNGPMMQYFNFIIQGSCADMLRAGLIRLRSAIAENGFDAFPILTIHDELVYECKTEQLSEFVKVVKRELSTPEGWELEFPVDIKISATTFENKELYKEAA